MNAIIIKSQAEWDALPKSFDTETWIEIRSESEVVVRHTPGSSKVTAYGSSKVTACGSSTVTAYGSSTVRAYGSSTVTACGSSTVTAYGSSTVTAYDSSTVAAYGSSTVTAYGSSTVRACGSSTVTAYDSSTVTAYDSPTVRACGSSTVTAYDSSTVRAYGSSAIHAHSVASTLTILGFAVAILNVRLKVAVKSKTATVVQVNAPSSEKAWCEFNGVDVKRGFATVFKRVSADFKTQEGTPNETPWNIGSTLEHKAWDPEKKECGAGKYHACPAPHYCNQYRGTFGDRYVAIRVAIEDMFLWKDKPEHPNKIAFRKGLVLHECDVHGRKIGGAK